jgi:hypothetical protein
VGDDWIDEGTMCRTRSVAPGSCANLLRARCSTTPFPGSGDKSAFDASHIYSQAKEAATKRAIDLEIIGGDYDRSDEISLKNEDYLKKLIEIGSRHKQKVSAHARNLQFFIIHGGGEGLLPTGEGLENKNAGRMEEAGETTDGKPETDLYDKNDIITVFDKNGDVVSAARLERPLSIPGYWTEKTANKVYNSWHNKDVFIYRNDYFFKLPPLGDGVIYLGLGVDDGFRGRATVDLHKQEATNGCIFIVDDKTPTDLSAKDKQGRTVSVMDKGKHVDVPLKEIDVFEPALIVDVLKAKGMKPEDMKDHRKYLGTMHIVEIK